MKLAHLIRSKVGWLSSGGGGSPVICSRIRLARNLRQYPFPGWAKKPERERILNELLAVVSSLPEMARPSVNEAMSNFDSVEKQILVEQHLISREHAVKGIGSGLVVNRTRTISVMINEEDHLRMQVFRSGSQLKALWKSINRIDSALDEKLGFAFSSQIGYLTSCPSNVGTGLRASVMMHLPAIVMSDQIGQVIKAINRIGLAVRGLYGEGTEAMGNLFQISNQITLGESELQIIDKINKVVKSVVETERNACQKLVEDRPHFVADEIGRAYGILSHCYSISSKDALNLISLLRLGVDLGALPSTACDDLDELFILIQPGHLKRDREGKLYPEERDILRADLLRKNLKKWTSPDMVKIGMDSPKPKPKPKKEKEKEKDE